MLRAKYSLLDASKYRKRLLLNRHLVPRRNAQALTIVLDKLSALLIFDRALFGHFTYPADIESIDRPSPIGMLGAHNWSPRQRAWALSNSQCSGETDPPAYVMLESPLLPPEMGIPKESQGLE